MRKFKILYLAVTCFILVGMAALAAKGRREEESYEELYSEAVVVTEPETEEETEEEPVERIIPTLEIDGSAMKEINEDYIAWLNLPDTDISYPVVLGEDNEEYLHRDFQTKSYAYAGCLFLDAFSEKGVAQDNLIIYGHNMKNGSMFGTLKKFRDQEYFDSHPYIELYLEDETRIYEVFSVREVSSDISTLNYALDGFTTEEYAESAKEDSECFREVETEYSQIITLSTCVNNDARRLIVNAIRVQ